jgi:transcriptional regulator with AAA-type ATPase domain/tetratricopeptide (TPR) repeat protein
MGAQLEALQGESPRIVAIRAQVAQLLARQTGARRLPPVLILGETGTGKGLLAGAIHQAGPRRDSPFVAVNCAAIPETLLEAELFGYERGAFTDARQAKPGLFQTAHGGTLFLDEIGLLPPALQGKLLTALEDRAVRRLGSTRAEPVDVALVAATSADLKQAIGEGRFREDLYHRLAVISLELPPLRARGGDILHLADYFLARAGADYSLPARVLAPDARELLVAYRWPGNVRELANALERVALLSVAEEITTAMLDFLVRTPGDAAEVSAPPVPESLDDALRGHVEAALRGTGGNIRRTAAALGISRNTLRARMDKYGLRNSAAALRAPPRNPPPPEVAAPTEWERRHLAFLRARLLPSSTVDAARALAVIAEKVRSFGGRIEDSGPTGLLAVFGLEPVDNAPSHAALAALAIHNAAAHVVISLHCDHHAVRPQGSTFDIALDGKAATWPILENLVTVERPGAIVVTEAVVPFVTRHFVLERLRDAGRDAWVLLRRDTAPTAWTRLVGRSSELALLREASAWAEKGHGQIVSIVGEAGVGKSRLLHEAVRPLQGWLVLSCGGAAYATHTSYFPLVEALKSFCRIQDTATAAEVRERVARGAGDPDELMPPLLDLLGVLPPEDAFHAVDPPLRRQRTHDALRQVFLGASVAQPLCLIVEDLHWIDVETQAVLDRLVNGVPAARVLLLVNYRPEYQHSWSNKTHYSQLRLDVLPVESAGELLDALLGDDPGLAPLKQRLIGSGNPFFLEETVRALVETKALDGPRGRYRLTQPVQAIQVPPTVQAILAARIDRLAPKDKRLLQVASAVGKDVPFALLQAIAELPEEVLRRGLESLQAAEFLYETGRYPDLAYSFKHALTHEVTYGALLQDRRKTLHARIVGAIERCYPDRLTEHVERLAHHAVRGEMWDQAVTHLRQAGLKALARSANQEAVSYFEQALVALGHRPESHATLEQAIDLRFDLKTSLLPLGAFERIVDYLREAESLARTLDDQRRLGQLSVHMCHTLRLAGQPTEAIAFGQDAQTLAESLGDIPLLVSGNLYLGSACLWTGDYRRAEDLLLKVLQLLEGEPSRERFALTGFPAVMARVYLTWIFADQGRFREGIVRGQEGMRLAETLDHPYSLAAVCWILAYLQIARGDLSHAVRLLERGATVSHEWNVTLLSVLNTGRLGYAYVLLGRTAEGIPLLEQALSAIGTMGFGEFQSRFVVYLAEAYILADRLEDALEFAGRALTFARQGGHRGYEAWALRLLGEVTARRDPPEHAEGHYREALALAEELGMRPLVAHCHLGLGRLFARTGPREQAQEHFATATTLYRDMGMTYWLEQAGAAGPRVGAD